MNELARENEHLEGWRIRNGWQHPRFVFAEQRHANLPQIDINLAAVPWVRQAGEDGVGPQQKQQQRRSSRSLAMQSQLSH
jgi:hypothetical protein